MRIWLALLALAAVIWWLARSPPDLVIQLRRGRVAVTGRIAAGRKAIVERFLQEQLPEVPRLRVNVRYPRGAKPLRIDVRGRISPGERQMIRNFLLTEL